VDLVDSGVDYTTYDENCSYQVINGFSRRSVHQYECCPEPYVDITLQFAPKAMTFE